MVTKVFVRNEYNYDMDEASVEAGIADFATGGDGGVTNGVFAIVC